jgi:hypothetical protein
MPAGKSNTFKTFNTPLGVTVVRKSSKYGKEAIADQKKTQKEDTPKYGKKLAKHFGAISGSSNATGSAKYNAGKAKEAAAKKKGK